MTGAIVGIDAGTSGIKVAAFSETGRLLHREERSASPISRNPGWVELDLEAYWTAVVSALRAVNEQLDNVIGVGISTTAPTTVLFDRDLEPMRYGLTYLDNRAADELDGIVSVFGSPEEYFRKIGNRLGVSTCAASNLRWLSKNDSEVWAGVRHFGYLNSFLCQRLTRNVGVDWTHASFSGLYGLSSGPREWAAELAEAYGLSREILPRIHAPHEPIGHVEDQAASETGFPRGVPVAIGCADTAAAAFGLGLTNGGDAFESVGTSGVLTYVLDQPEFDAVFLNRRHVVDKRWLAHGAMSMAGGALSWAQTNMWPEISSVCELEGIAAKAPAGANGVVFLPYLSGERSPIWDPNARGGWVGLTRTTERSDMIRAVFESGAYAMRQIMERAYQSWGIELSDLIAVGGGTKSALLNQIKADVLALRYRPRENPDAAAFGAALLGGIAGDLFNGPEDPAIPRLDEAGEYFPPQSEEARSAYDEVYGIYASLYPALSESMHAISAFCVNNRPNKR